MSILSRHSAAFVLGLAVGLAAAAPAVGAGLTGSDIVKRALDLQAGIQDYTANIKVTVNMPGLQVPERTAKLYFKRPDKVHVESKGVVMVPRQALFMGDLGSEIAKKSRVILAGQSRKDGALIYFLKVLPPEGQATTDRMLVWIRGDRFTIERLEVYADNKLRMGAQWEYQLVGGKFWLMKKLTARMPGREGFGRRRPATDPDEQPRPARTGPGIIIVRFSSVKVNTGLPDSLFVEKKKP